MHLSYYRILAPDNAIIRQHDSLHLSYYRVIAFPLSHHTPRFVSARAFCNSESAPLQVSTRSSVCVRARKQKFLSLSLVCPSVSLSGLPQLEPRAITAISPFHNPMVFPNPDSSHIYFVDSFIRWFMARQCSHLVCTLTRNHTPSLVGHTPKWLANSLSPSAGTAIYPNGEG